MVIRIYDVDVTIQVGRHAPRAFEGTRTRTFGTELPNIDKRAVVFHDAMVRGIRYKYMAGVSIHTHAVGILELIIPRTLGAYRDGVR